MGLLRIQRRVFWLGTFAILAWTSSGRAAQAGFLAVSQVTGFGVTNYIDSRVYDYDEERAWASTINGRATALATKQPSGALKLGVFGDGRIGVPHRPGGSDGFGAYAGLNGEVFSIKGATIPDRIFLEFEVEATFNSAFFDLSNYGLHIGVSRFSGTPNSQNGIVGTSARFDTFYVSSPESVLVDYRGWNTLNWTETSLHGTVRVPFFVDLSTRTANISVGLYASTSRELIIDASHSMTLTAVTDVDGNRVSGTFASGFVPTSDISTVPEPTSLALLGIGGIGLVGGWSRRRRR